MKNCSAKNGTVTLSAETNGGATVANGDTGAAVCTGYIDANGYKGPNEKVRCSGNEADTDNCHVDSSKAYDVYPVIMYDDKVEPGSYAARAVLLNKNRNTSNTSQGGS